MVAQREDQQLVAPLRLLTERVKRDGRGPGYFDICRRENAVLRGFDDLVERVIERTVWRGWLSFAGQCRGEANGGGAPLLPLSSSECSTPAAPGTAMAFCETRKR
jgi:hypothetical protein